MGLGIEQENGSSITPLALARLHHPTSGKPASNQRNLWAGLMTVILGRNLNISLYTYYAL